MYTDFWFCQVGTPANSQIKSLRPQYKSRENA